MAWSNQDRKNIQFLYSDVRRFSERAFTLRGAARVLGIAPLSLLRILDRYPHLPRGEYYVRPTEDGEELDNNNYRMFSESMIMDIRDQWAKTHIGAPRKDGRTTNNKTPTRGELRFRMRGGQQVYIKDKDEFIPVWRAEEW